MSARPSTHARDVYWKLTSDQVEQQPNRNNPCPGGASPFGGNHGEQHSEINAEKGATSDGCGGSTWACVLCGESPTSCGRSGRLSQTRRREDGQESAISYGGKEEEKEEGTAWARPGGEHVPFRQPKAAVDSLQVTALSSSLMSYFLNCILMKKKNSYFLPRDYSAGFSLNSSFLFSLFLSAQICLESHTFGPPCHPQIQFLISGVH